MKLFFYAFAWCFFASCVSSVSYSQINIDYSDALSGKVASASVNQKNVWSVNNNPATLLFTEAKSSIGFNIKQHDYITSLNQYQFTYYNKPNNNQSFGVSISKKGNKDLNIISSGICYALKLNEFTSIGSKLNVLHLQFGDVYGNNTLLTGDIGVYHSLNNYWQFGLSIKNISQQYLSNEVKESLNGTVDIGATYQATIKQSFLFNLSHSIYHEINYKFGYQHQINNSFSIGLGYQTFQSQFSWGFSFTKQKLTFALASNYQQYFGFKNQIDLIYVL